jgi:hypothetical protein
VNEEIDVKEETREGKGACKKRGTMEVEEKEEYKAKAKECIRRGGLGKGVYGAKAKECVRRGTGSAWGETNFLVSGRGWEPREAGA